jgi:hypothetical protein
MDKIVKDHSEYSISPTSGRLRKKIRKKKMLSRRRVKKYVEYFLWILLLAAFIYSLIIVIPELGIVSDKNPRSKTK